MIHKTNLTSNFENIMDEKAEDGKERMPMEHLKWWSAKWKKS